MSDFNFKFHDGDPVPPDQIEIVNWQEKEMEPAINIFLCFIGALHQIVDNALKNSEASGYGFNSNALGFQRNLKCSDLRRATGIPKQALKSFPVIQNPENPSKITDIINIYKSFCSSYYDFMEYYLTEIEASQNFLKKVFSPDSFKIDKLRCQIVHIQMFLDVWISRYFLRTKRSSYIKEHHQQVEKFVAQLDVVEKTIHQFVDGKLSQSETEIQLKKAVKHLYLELDSSLQSFNTIVQFSDPADEDVGDGFTLNVKQEVPAKLMRIINNRFKNIIWRISDLKFVAGSSVNDAILQVEALTVLHAHCTWNGRRFNVAVETFVPSWKQIKNEIEEDLVCGPDQTEERILNIVLEDKDLFKVRQDPVPEPVYQALIRPSFTLDDMTRSRAQEKRQETKSKVQESRAEEDEDDECSSNGDEDNDLDPDDNGHSTVESKTSSSKTSNFGSWSDKLDRQISSVKRKVKGAERMIPHGNKVELERARHTLDDAFKELDKMSVKTSEGTEDQWTQAEDLFLLIEEKQEYISTKLASLENEAINRQQMPKASLEKWNGDSSNFHDWKVFIRQMLKFKDETLNLATFKAHIADGPEKQKIMERIENCRSVDDALKILERFYGNFSILQPKLRAKLEQLPDNPVFHETESANIEAILNYLTKMKKHNMEKKYVDQDFINHFQHKLSSARVREITDNGINTCEGLEEFLYKCLKSNQLIQQTRPGPTTAGKRYSGRGVRTQLNLTTTEEDKRRLVCPICDKEHLVFKCPELKRKDKSLDEWKTELRKKKLCFKCLRKFETDHACKKEVTTRFVCKTHNVNKIICCWKDNNDGRSVTVNNNITTPEVNGDDENLNGVKIGGVGFQSEDLVFIDKNGKEVIATICYDSFASHSTINESLGVKLSKDIVDMGFFVNVVTYMGNKRERARKCSTVIKTKKGTTVVEMLVAKSFKNQLKEVQYDVPGDWKTRYGLKQEEKTGKRTSEILFGQDLAESFPAVLEVKNGMVLSRSRLTGKLILSGKTNQMGKTNNLQINKTLCMRENRKVEFSKENNGQENTKENPKNISGEEQENSGGMPTGEFKKKTLAEESARKTADNSKDNWGSKELKKNSQPEEEVEENLEDLDLQINETILERELDPILKQLTTDSININPFTRCGQCKNCPKCKSFKPHTPGDQEQEKLNQLLKEHVKFQEDRKRYVVDFPMTPNVKNLKTNEDKALKAMKYLEKKLIKLGLHEKFNKIVKKLMEDGVYVPVSCHPEVDEMQKSFITLTYSLHKRDENGVPKLRVCSNSSFHGGDNVSFNTCSPPCPTYLNKIEAVLTRFRTSSHFTFGDVQSCYHCLDCSLQSASLRRVWLKPDGMGGESEWTPYLTMKANFGDSLAGPAASLAIHDAIEKEASEALANQIDSLAIMDDLAITEESRGLLLKKRSMVEKALAARGLYIKSWISNGDKEPDSLKYLSYIYLPSKDRFKINIKFNLSETRRGSKVDPDVLLVDGVDSHVEKFHWTKRRLAGVNMSIAHDPLGLIGPSTNSFKFLMREVVELKMDWDTKLSPELASRVSSAVKIIMRSEALSFPRQCLFVNSKRMEFDIYYDASLAGIGVVVAVNSWFENGKNIYRVLKTKSKMTGKDITNCPRAELMGALVACRVYNLLKFEIEEFLSSYGGKVSFRFLGDSQIVIGQIQKDYFYFKMWVSSRLQEIKELTSRCKNSVEFLHISTQENYADALTRPFNGEVKEIPWAKQNLREPTTAKAFKPTTKNILDFPEVNLKKVVQVENNTMRTEKVEHIAEQTEDKETSLIDILQFAVAHKKVTEGDEVDEEDGVEQLVDGLLKRNSDYFRVRNVIARIINITSCNWGSSLDKAEKIIFKTQQSMVKKYLKSFKGNEFYVKEVDGVHYVRGRNTVSGVTQLLLVPPHTLLYDRISSTFHKKTHRKGIYVRGQLLRSGYYLPSALPRLKSLSDSCSFCRKRVQKTLNTEMGALGDERTGENGVFQTCQADLYGPLNCKEYVNQRAPSRKIWLLVIFCEMSRYTVLQIVEGLSKQNLMDALEAVFYRYGKISKLKTDWGTNFVAARDELGATIDDVGMGEKDFQDLATELQSKGTVIELRSPHAKFIQGGVESMNKNILKCMGGLKQTMNPFQWIRSLEKFQFIINERPVSLSNSLEILVPNDINSLNTRIPAKSLEEFKEKADDNVQLFHEKWMDLFYSNLYRQKKWFNSDKIELGSLVLVMDNKNAFGYPSLGKVTKVEKGRDGVERYFTVSHKTKTGQLRELRRPSQQLVLVLAKSESGLDPDLRKYEEEEREPEDIVPGGGSAEDIVPGGEAAENTAPDDEPAEDIAPGGEVAENIPAGDAAVPVDIAHFADDAGSTYGVADIVSADPEGTEDALNVNRNLSFNTDQASQNSKTGGFDGDELEEILDPASFVAPEDKMQNKNRKVIKTSVQNVAKKIKNLRKK